MRSIQTKYRRKFFRKKSTLEENNDDVVFVMMIKERINVKGGKEKESWIKKTKRNPQNKAATSSFSLTPVNPINKVSMNYFL